MIDLPVLQPALSRGHAIFNTLQGFVPVLGALIHSAENIFTAPGTGQQKLQHVLDTFKNVLVLSGNPPADVDQIMPTIAIVVNNIVAATKAPQTAS